MKFDAVVIGSGIGGLACAAALARFGRRVAVFEKHTVAGGLTHTFQRDAYTWDVGVHYLGQMGPGEPMRRVMDWLSGGTIDFAALGTVYDVVRLADGTRFEYARPRAALEASLREAFPAAHGDIERYLAALDAARRSFTTPFQQHAMPAWLAHAIGWLKAPARERWWGRTVTEVLGECTSDPRLAAVLSAQWGDHGGKPARASFAVHAMITDHYLEGAWYPVGGAGAFARGLAPVIEAAGGTVRTGAPVAGILLEDGRATGVELEDGTRHAADVVISGVGARGTVSRLLPPGIGQSPWGRAVNALEPSFCHTCLYVGLEGDVEAAGASRANHWIYDTPDIEATWDDPFSQVRAPMVFVSFPSLKDPARPAGTQHHTAEVVAWTDWSVFEPWADTRWGDRPEDYRALRDSLERSLRAQFEQAFPGLAPMIRLCELSTPLSTVHFTSHERGAVYGLATTPARFASRALDIRTPVPGLLLTGQDVVTPGVVGALMGGILSAAVVEPRVFTKLPR
jgi:all-trans-retinol 13,14-reductase